MTRGAAGSKTGAYRSCDITVEGLRNDWIKITEQSSVKITTQKSSPRGALLTVLQFVPWLHFSKHLIHFPCTVFLFAVFAFVPHYFSFVMIFYC